MALSRYNNNCNFPFFNTFDDLFAVPSTLFLERPTFPHISPGYEINQDEKSFQLAVDVPGVKASDMKMDLEHDGRVLHLSGGRKKQEGNNFSETKFDQRFTIGKDVDTNKITANLENGVLVVNIPKKEKEESVVRNIAITEGPALPTRGNMAS
mmetsp:Transcript_20862/g.32107  ORF Transcript_20862/g.32107 Transcript_20862/m.32107 type:complete len:153 (-) Transcript_20862:925-1383(-)